MITNLGKYYLYRHIRLDKNEVFYIGIGTKQKGYYSRAINKHRDNLIWCRIIAKTDYKVEIILESNDYEFIKEKEKEFITLYGRKNLGLGTLANMTDGGEGTTGIIVSEETKIKLKEARKGFVLSKEAREKISKANKGKKGEWFHTEKTKQILRKLKTGTTHSQKTKDSLSKKFKGRPAEWNEKKVFQYSLEGKFLKEWKSVTEASINLSILICDISYCALGNKHTAGNFQWRYEKFDEILEFNKKQNRISKSKVINQYDLEMNFIKEWKGSREPSEKLNVNRGAIRNCLSNIAKTAGGFIWKYKRT